MTKWMIIASTAFVWTAGFAATAALSYVTREPAPVAVVAKLPTPPPARALLAKTMPVTREDAVIVLPTVEIRGSSPVAPAKAVAAPSPPPTHEIHCSPFRPLEQGSSSVQICD